MSDQDFEGLDDLWSAVKKSATSGHAGDKEGRIFDGCVFVTQREWKAISSGPSSKTWDDMNPVEKLSSIPIRIIDNGSSVELSDGRIMLGFNDTLYLIPEPTTYIAPLTRLHLDGKYI